MLEVLQFYVSGFWIWLGITIGLYLVMLPVLVFCAGVMGASVRATSE